MVCTKEFQELVLILPINKVIVIDKCKPMLHILTWFFDFYQIVRYLGDTINRLLKYLNNKPCR